VAGVVTTIPVLPQRQDSTSEQLSDLIMVANRLGMYNAADAIKIVTKNIPEPKSKPKWGCHCDLEPHMQPDGCVIDTNDFHNCIYAKEGMRKEQCEYWQKIKE
jgi:hypothetical protein